MFYSFLPNRALISITGEDARTFLQGIISNDIYKVTTENTIYALILTPQGKYLHDLFISEHQGGLLLECDATRSAELLRKLTLYKLRSKVTLEEVSSRYRTVWIWDETPASLPGYTTPFLDGIAYTDPRSALLYKRALLPQENAEAQLIAAGFLQGTLCYDTVRIRAAIAEGEKDLLPEKAFPLEYGMESLNAIDFKKGCYVGQEITARTKYRGTVRKAIHSITADKILPEYGTELTAAGIKIGVLRSHKETDGLALLRIEEYAKAEGQKIEAGDCVITVT